MAEFQTIQTKNFGDIHVLRSYQEGNLHIAKTCDENGNFTGYAHMSGLDIKDKAELRKAIPAAELQEALDWWDKRFDEAQRAPRRIVMEADGSLIFDDGTPVKTDDEIDNSIKPGPAREAMRQAFYVMQAQKQQQTQPQAAKPAARPKPTGNKAKGKKVSQPSAPKGPPVAEAGAQA